MPRRAPLDPHGWYHVGTRGSYGQPLFRQTAEYELFLRLYLRTANKYGWVTPEWALMRNHDHFVIQLTDGGLSEGLRELHGTFSRRIHAIYGVTGQGHLVRHGFFARQLTSDADVLATCRYIALNHARATGQDPELAPWAGYPATIGLRHPQPFHSPSVLLSLISSSPAKAREAYRAFVQAGLVLDGHVPSPNDVGNADT